jgi:hypothetical protein
MPLMLTGAGAAGALAGLPPVALGASFVAIASPTYCFSNDAGTIACTDGATIRSWKNAVDGTLYVWTGATMPPPVRPVLRGSSGNWRADFSAASTGFDFVGSIWPTGAMSFVTRFTPGGGVGGVLGSPDSAGKHPFNIFGGNSGGTVSRFNDGPSRTLTASAATISYSGTNATGAGSVEQMRLDGGAWNTVSNLRPSRGGLSQTLWIGIAGAGFFCPMPSFKTVCLFGSVLSDADFAAVEAWAATL